MLFFVGGLILKKFGLVVVEKGCFVVDNLSAFRMTDGVSLVISEVNSEVMVYLKFGGKVGIIVNLNCFIIIVFMVVMLIYCVVGVECIVVSTY